MAAQPSAPLTFEEWLTSEELTDERHELVGGELVLLQRGTDRHDTIAQAIFERLVGQ